MAFNISSGVKLAGMRPYLAYSYKTTLNIALSVEEMTTVITKNIIAKNAAVKIT